MAQQGKQMRVGACKGFVFNNPVKPVSLANGNRNEVISSTFFKIVFQALLSSTPLYSLI